MIFQFVRIHLGALCCRPFKLAVTFVAASPLSQQRALSTLLSSREAEAELPEHSVPLNSGRGLHTSFGALQKYRKHGLPHGASLGNSGACVKSQRKGHKSCLFVERSSARVFPLSLPSSSLWIVTICGIFTFQFLHLRFRLKVRVALFPPSGDVLCPVWVLANSLA